MASGNDVSHTPERSGSNGSHSTGSCMADKASLHTVKLQPQLNDARDRVTLPNEEVSVLNPYKKQKTSDATSTITFDVSATTTTTTKAPATTTTNVTNIKTPVFTTRGLTTTTKTKAAISTAQTTTDPQHINATASPKQERMTAASFFGEEEILFVEEVRGTKRKHESIEASASPPTVSLPSTSTSVTSYSPQPSHSPLQDPKILPEKIVLLIDRQDAYLKSFYYPNVLHIYDNKLNYGNAFSMIKKTDSVFKNTLFVMLCGTMSALKQEINKECHLFLCKEPLYNYFIQDFKAPTLQEHLINEAKVLRKKIVAMENCDIIFSGVLPVRIDRAEAYEAERHYNQTGHQVRVNSSRCEGLYNRLCTGLKEFNKWAKEDARLLGFPNWSLVDSYTVAVSSAPEDSNQHCTDLAKDGNSSLNDSRSKFPTADSSTHQHSEDVMIDIKNILQSSCNLSQDNRTHTTNSSSLTQDSENPTNSTESNSSSNSPTESSTKHQAFTHPTEANGVTLTMECMLKRRLALKMKVRETFLRVKKVTRTPKPLASPITDAKKEDEVVVHKLKSHQPAAPYHSGDVAVVVVGDAKHNNILSNMVDPFLSCKKVTLRTLQKLSPSGIADLVNKYYSQVSWNTNTVWMLCFGILDFIDLNVYPICLNQQCKSQLLNFSIKRDEWLGKIESKVKEVMNTVHEFKYKLEHGILSSTMLLIVPPMQIAVLDGQALNNHRELHRVAKKHNLFICDKDTYDLIKMFYSRLFEVWPVGFGKLIEGIYQKPMSQYITRCKKRSINLFGGGVASACTFVREWKNMMEEVINITLKTYPLVSSEVKISSHLSFMPFVSLIEPSPNIGRMLSLNLQKKPNEEDRLFRHVVVVGNQLPAELDELCHQLSIHVMPQRITFDEAGKALIQKYQKLWPKGTLWVILSDILHMATLENLQQCRTQKCKEILKAYVWEPSIAKKSKRKAHSDLKVNSLIYNAKKFSESLTDNLGEGSAVFLPPVTPVFLLHTNDAWKHEDLHKWCKWCKKAMPVFMGRKNLRKNFMDLKHAWLKMLKSYIEKYPMLMNILKLYEQGKEDWIRTLGNFLVHFANAEKDNDDAVFSDADFSSGEETVMGEENTENLAGSTSPHHPSTVQFSTPTVAQTSRTSPVPVSAPEPSLHPMPPALNSAFPSYPKIAVRQDLLDKQDITATIPESTLERTHWTITSETTVDTPSTAENTQQKKAQRTLPETPLNIPQTSVNILGRGPKGTLLKTPVKTSSIPINSSLKAHQKTALESTAEVPVLQHQHDKGPQQTVIKKDHLASSTGQLTLEAEESLPISRTEGNQLTFKTKEGKLDRRTDKGRTHLGTSRTKKTGVIPEASGTLKTKITARAKKSQISPRKKDQRVNGIERKEQTVKKQNLGSQREKDQIPRTERDQAFVQGEDVTFSKEDQVIIERAVHLQRRFTLTEDVDAEMSDENSGQWIILSETEEDHEDLLEEGISQEECRKDLSKNNEQDTVSLERETVNDHSKDSVTTKETADEKQSLVPKAKHSKDTTALETPIKSHFVVSETKNQLSKDSKDNSAASTVVKHTKNNSTASSALDKSSKGVTVSTNKHNKDSNTAPTMNEDSKKSNTEASAGDDHKKIDSSSAVDKHRRSTNTALSAVDGNSNATPSTAGKYKKSSTVLAVDEQNKNTMTPVVGEHGKNSNTELSTVVKHKKIDTAALSAVDKHSKNSNTAPSAMGKNKNSNTTPSAKDKHCKNNNTAPTLDDCNKTVPVTIDKYSKKRNTASLLNKYSKNSNSSPPKHDKHSNTASSVVDNSKNSDTTQTTLDKQSRDNKLAPPANDENKNHSTVPSTVNENKKSDTALPTLDKYRKSSNAEPLTVDKNKNSNIVLTTMDKHTDTSSALDKLSKDSNTIPKTVNNHSNTASPALKNKHKKPAPSAVDEPSKDSNTAVKQFLCLRKSRGSHDEEDNCKVSTEQVILPNPQETEEDSLDAEALSNTDSVETIILDNSEQEQESLEYSTEECQPMTLETIPKIGSKPYCESLDSPSGCRFVESQLPQEGLVQAEDWGDSVIKETEFVVGSSPSGGAGTCDSHPVEKKGKPLFSNGSSSTLCSSSSNNSFDSDLMEDCFRELLEHLRVTTQVLWHTYLLTPETHPDFEEKLAEFCQLYKESNGREARQDSKHCEEAWRVFWKDWVKKQLQEEKQKNKLALFENFKPMIKNSQRTCRTNGENQPKHMKMDEGTKENHMFESDCVKTNTWLPLSVVQKEENSWLLLQSPPRVNQKSLCVSKNISCQLSPGVEQVKLNSLSVSPCVSKQTAQSINLEEAMSLSPPTKGTTNTSHSFDSCLTTMSHCQWMISNISKAASDSEAARHNSYLSKEAKESSRRRVRLILRCFKMLSEFGLTLGTLAPNVVPIIKSVLDVGVQSDKALGILSDSKNVQVMKMCSEKLRQVGEMAKGAYQEKLIRCSSDINELLDSISISFVKLEMIEGLHIPTIAKLTAQKDTPSVLKFVKDALAMRNMHNPPKSLVNKLFLAISTYHSIMATQTSPTIAMTSSPGTS